MSQCVPRWDLEDINPNHDRFKLDYEVAELTWENGHLAMHELGHRRVSSKSQSITSWDKPRAVETLEAIVNQATHQPYFKPHVAVNDDEVVPWLHSQTNTHTTTAGSLNASVIMSSDPLVPSSNNKTGDNSGKTHWVTKRVHDAGCSTRVGSNSGDSSAFIYQKMDVPAAHDWSSCRDISMSGTIETFDTYDDNLGGQRLTSTSIGSPENFSSGMDFSKSTSLDDSVYHCKTQRERNEAKETKRGKAKSSILNKRRRTAAIHNQSERKRRDKINQKMTTLQKMVPNSSKTHVFDFKTDKSSMLDEVIKYVKQLQAQVHIMNRMNISPMMMPLVMQHQQMQMSMMNSMGMGIGMGIGMGMGGMDMNTMGPSNIQAGFHPSAFIHMPSWNSHATDRAVNPSAMATDPMSAFLACQSQSMNMDAYSRIAALYQHMQNQQCGPIPKN